MPDSHSVASETSSRADYTGNQGSPSSSRQGTKKGLGWPFADSHPSPPTAKNWLFPWRVSSCRKVASVALDSRCLRELPASVAPGAGDPGPLGSSVPGNAETVSAVGVPNAGQAGKQAMEERATPCRQTPSVKKPSHPISRPHTPRSCKYYKAPKRGHRLPRSSGGSAQASQRSGFRFWRKLVVIARNTASSSLKSRSSP